MIKTFFLDQHGCAKNQVDGELLIDLLYQNDWQKASEPEEACLIIINSCGFIESAKKESIEALISARAAYPHAKIVLAGCLAQRYADQLAHDLPEADAFFGNGDLSQFIDFITPLFDTASVAEAEQLTQARPILTPPQNGVCAGNRRELLSFPGSAFVKITEGCNNCCSFCAIPLIRGSLRSRDIQDIIDEISILLKRGIFEINLIGQDLASFSDLPQLLNRISALQGNFWIRLLYIHPDNFSADILPIIAHDKRILPYFDIPFQHASEKILSNMNRKGNAAVYENLIATIRTALPEAIIRTTFLIGFPAESDSDFKLLCDFVQAIRADWAGSFIYSKEDGTKAACLKGRVPKKIALQRQKIFEDIQTQITDTKLAARIGNIYDVLIEELIQDTNEDDGETLFFALGRAWFQAGEVDGAVVIHYNADAVQAAHIKSGSIVKCKITKVHTVDLEGILV